jgi:hypothetical protein
MVLHGLNTALKHLCFNCTISDFLTAITPLGYLVPFYKSYN